MDGVVTTSDEKRLPHLMERLQEVLIMIHETALFKGDPFAYISIWARVQTQQEYNTITDGGSTAPLYC